MITTPSLPSGTVGVSYTPTTLTATGGETLYTWSKTSGNLPTGLSLSSTGVLSGTPSKADTFSFTVTVTDANFFTTTKACSITIYNPLSIPTSSLSPGALGISYSQNLTASGGKAPYTWVKTSGNLPDGLGLSEAGVITGTPTALGTFDFTVQVRDANSNTDTEEFSISIYEPLIITTSSLPSGTVGTSYTPTTLAATGGKTTYTWSGNMPDGLTINSLTGEISGTPTTPGTFTFTVQVRDANSITATMQVSVTIDGLTCSVPIMIEETPDGQTIKIVAMKYAENLEFNNAISVSLKGGYYCEFISNPWYTTIGMLTISAGTVTIENIVIW